MSNLNIILEQIINLQEKTVVKLTSLDIPVLPDDITTQGNTFNGVEQLVKTNTSGKIPVQLIDVDSLDIPTGNIPDNITTQGNTFNGIDQLVKTDNTGKIPSTLIVSNSYSKTEIDTKFEDLYTLWEKEY